MSKKINKLISYCRLMRLHRPIPILLIFWPTLWALWLAGEGKPSLWLLFIFTFGIVIMRAAGDVINDVADRNFDGFVTRTKDRPLATGEISPREAIVLFALLMIIAFALVLTLNRLTILLAFVGAFLTIFYPFTKRFFHAPQLVLGLAYNWGVPMAFAAQTNALPLIAWLVYLISLLWTIAYDTEYAMADREDDLKLKLKSTAILFGRADKIMIGLLQLLVLILLVALGWWNNFTWPYYLSIVIGSLLFIYQQYLIAGRHPQLCIKAFLHNQWFGLVIFLGIGLHFLLGRL